MTWWMWVLLWGVLLLGAAGVLGWTGWRVFRSGVRLGRSLGESADRAAAAQAAPTPAAPGTHPAFIPLSDDVGR